MGTTESLLEAETSPKDHSTLEDQSASCDPPKSLLLNDSPNDDVSPALASSTCQRPRRMKPITRKPLYRLKGLIVGGPNSGKRSLLQRLEGKNPFQDCVDDSTGSQIMSSIPSSTKIPYKSPQDTLSPDRIQLHVQCTRNNRLQDVYVNQKVNFIIVMINPKYNLDATIRCMDQMIRRYLDSIGYLVVNQKGQNVQKTEGRENGSDTTPVCIAFLLNFRDEQGQDFPKEMDMRKHMEGILQERKIPDRKMVIDWINISLLNCFGLDRLHTFIYKVYLAWKETNLEHQLLTVRSQMHHTNNLTVPIISYDEFVKTIDPGTKGQTQMSENGPRSIEHVKHVEDAQPIENSKRENAKPQRRDLRHSFHPKNAERVQTLKQPVSLIGKDALEAFLASDDEEDENNEYPSWQQKTSFPSSTNSSNDEDLDDDDFFYDLSGKRQLNHRNSRKKHFTENELQNRDDRIWNSAESQYVEASNAQRQEIDAQSSTSKDTLDRHGGCSPRLTLSNQLASSEADDTSRASVLSRSFTAEDNMTRRIDSDDRSEHENLERDKQNESQHAQHWDVVENEIAPHKKKQGGKDTYDEDQGDGEFEPTHHSSIHEHDSSVREKKEFGEENSKVAIGRMDERSSQPSSHEYAAKDISGACPSLEINNTSEDEDDRSVQRSRPGNAAKGSTGSYPTRVELGNIGEDDDERPGSTTKVSSGAGPSPEVDNTSEDKRSVQRPTPGNVAKCSSDAVLSLEVKNTSQAERFVQRPQPGYAPKDSSDPFPPLDLDNTSEDQDERSVPRSRPENSTKTSSGACSPQEFDNTDENEDERSLQRSKPGNAARPGAGASLDVGNTGEDESSVQKSRPGNASNDSSGACRSLELDNTSEDGDERSLQTSRFGNASDACPPPMLDNNSEDKEDDDAYLITTTTAVESSRRIYDEESDQEEYMISVIRSKNVPCKNLDMDQAKVNEGTQYDDKTNAMSDNTSGPSPESQCHDTAKKQAQSLIDTQPQDNTRGDSTGHEKSRTSKPLESPGSTPAIKDGGLSEAARAAIAVAQREAELMLLQSQYPATSQSPVVKKRSKEKKSKQNKHGKSSKKNKKKETALQS